MIILFGHQKGGVGKSTVSINFAYECRRWFKDLILLDLDSQNSAKLFNQLRTKKIIVQYIYTSLHKGKIMHRLNLTIDEALYEQARAFSFIEKKSISAMIRESLNEYISSKTRVKQQANLILEADDEKEILSIMSNDEFSTSNDFRTKFNL
jgi:cellulose biosynthesis protein BcsQ